MTAAPAPVKQLDSNVEVPNLRLYIWTPKGIEAKDGTLELKKRGDRATYFVNGLTPMPVDLPREVIRRIREEVLKDGFDPSKSLLVHVPKGFCGTPIPRLGVIEVYPFEPGKNSYTWFFATMDDQVAQGPDDDDVSVFDRLNQRRLEFSHLRQPKPMIRVFEQSSGHFEVTVYDGGESETEDAFTEIHPGGPYYLYPIVPCPPDEEPPREEILLSDPSKKVPFETAMKSARAVYYLCSYNQNALNIELPEDSDGIGLFHAGTIAVLTVPRGYRKHTVPVILDNRTKKLQIRGAIELV